MINFKWGIISGCAALVISVTLGIINDVNTLHIFLRALIFTVIFFGLGIGVYILINSFYPEILYADNEDETQEDANNQGSRINITLGNTGEYAVPELYRNSGDSQELGNINDLVSGVFKPSAVAESAPKQVWDSKGIDRKEEEDYNELGSDFTEGLESFQFQDSPPETKESDSFEKPVFTPSFGDDSADLGGLADLESMATAFSSGYGGDTSPSKPFEEGEPLRVNKGNKPMPMPDDFNPKELAEGIRTVLSKDKH